MSTTDVFRRGTVESIDTDEDGCSTAEVYLDGKTDEDTVTVELPPQPAAVVRQILYTIGDITDDTPLALELPELLAGTITAIKCHGPSASGASVDLVVESSVEETTADGDGWTTCSVAVGAGDEVGFEINDVSGGTGPMLCYIRIKPSPASLVEVGDKIYAQKVGHRQGGHGRWRKAN